ALEHERIDGAVAVQRQVQHRPARGQTFAAEHADALEVERRAREVERMSPVEHGELRARQRSDARAFRCYIPRMSRGTREVFVSSLDLSFEVLENDAIIGPAIERGMWEEFETRLFRAHLVPGCKVLDLGANVGWFGAVAIRAGCEVHCFEPV